VSRAKTFKVSSVRVVGCRLLHTGYSEVMIPSNAMRYSDQTVGCQSCSVVNNVHFSDGFCSHPLNEYLHIANARDDEFDRGACRVHNERHRHESTVHLSCTEYFLTGHGIQSSLFFYLGMKRSGYIAMAPRSYFMIVARYTSF
jgi:hypothetical protein